MNIHITASSTFADDVTKSVEDALKFGNGGAVKFNLNYRYENVNQEEVPNPLLNGRPLPAARQPQTANANTVPFVEQVVFVSTPQHGAMLAARQLITDLAARFITLPMAALNGIAQAATSTGDEKLTALLRRPPTLIDNMNPNNPGLQMLASSPVSPRIKAHSIIAVEGDGPKEKGDDGVVAYKSAHIDEAVSERVVRWSHSVQDQPEAIEEIRRILLEHLATREDKLSFKSL